MIRGALLAAVIVAFPLSAHAGDFWDVMPYAGVDQAHKGDIACNRDVLANTFGARVGRGNEHGFAGHLYVESSSGKGKCDGSFSLVDVGIEGELPLTDNTRRGQLGVGAAAALVGSGSVHVPGEKLLGVGGSSYEGFAFYRWRFAIAGRGGVRRLFHLMPMIGWKQTSISYKENLGSDAFGNPISKQHDASFGGPYGQLAIQIWFGRPAEGT